MRPMKWITSASDEYYFSVWGFCLWNYIFHSEWKNGLQSLLLCVPTKFQCWQQKDFYGAGNVRIRFHGNVDVTQELKDFWRNVPGTDLAGNKPGKKKDLSFLCSGSLRASQGGNRWHKRVLGVTTSCLPYPFLSTQFPPSAPSENVSIETLLSERICVHFFVLA